MASVVQSRLWQDLMQTIEAKPGKRERKNSPVAVLGELVHEYVPGVSAGMRSVEEALKRLADRQLPVLLMGEHGTGKATLALELHRSRVGRLRGFTKVDCANVTTGFLETALNPGNGNSSLLWINDGTVLLQEIGSLPPSLQPQMAKIIAAILAAPVEQRGAVPLIATTTKELRNEVQAGRFRDDLYYMISGVSLQLPPLRHRRADIPLLADCFLARAAMSQQRTKPAISQAMQRFLLECPWPGNVAELREAARMIVAVGDEGLAIAALTLAGPGGTALGRLAESHFAKAGGAGRLEECRTGIDVEGSVENHVEPQACRATAAD